jgi:TonB family protein
MRSLAVMLLAIALARPLPAQQKGLCKPTLAPRKLPAPSALVDSARAIADLAQFGTTTPTMVFSLVFAEHDSLPEVRPLEDASMLAAAVLVHAVRPQKPSGLWAIRVRVAQGASAALTLERSVYCPPFPQRTDAPTMVAVRVEPSEQSAVKQGRVRMSFQVLVSEQGQAIDVRMIQSSGIRDMDDQMMQDLQRVRFQPALLDGKPMQALYRSDGSPRL